MNILAIPDERELSLDEANIRIHQELASFGLTSHVQTFGQNIVNTRVMLINPATGQQTAGSGKGYKEHATTGAYFEALEHYLTNYHGLDTPLELLPTHSFTRSDFFIGDSLLDIVVQVRNAHIACRRYYNPLDGQSFPYPIALSMPGYSDNPIPGDTFNYASLKRYCCNSGIAIGATYNEAVLHAINECLERDALSLFLLEHFYYQHDEPLLKLKRPEPNDRLFDLWHSAEQELQTEIVVLDISSEFCAKTYLAFSANSLRPVNLFGSGTSLFAEHAASRALTELVQMTLAVQVPEAALQIARQHRHLMTFPRLLRCLQMETDSLLTRARHQTVTLPASASPCPLSEQIHILAEDIRSHQKELGISVMHKTARGTTLANVVIPGLERFYIVSTGNVVVPQARGRTFHSRCRAAYV